MMYCATPIQEQFYWYSVVRGILIPKCTNTRMRWLSERDLN